MARAPRTKIVSKKHLARLERERLQTRYIMIGSVIVLLLVIGLVGYGILDQLVLQPNKPVATINGDSIPVNEFQANVRYRRNNIVQQYRMFSQYFGSDPSYYQQVASELSPATLIGQQVLNQLIEDRIIRQEAKRRGITVSPEEVDEAIQQDFGYYANGTPTPTVTQPAVPTSTYSPLQETLIAPRPTITPTLSITETASLTATAALTATATAVVTATPTQSPTATPSGVLTPTATATITPSPTPYTFDAYKQNFQNWVNGLSEAGVVSDAQLRKIYESQLYREKVMKAVLDEMNLPRSEEQVWARHILVSSEVTATQILQELQNGADFAALAAQYSTDTSNASRGGDLGWFGKGKMVAEFEQAAWSLQVGEIVSAPVKTSFGYHIIQALGHEVRPLSDAEYSSLRQRKFQEWLDQKRIEAQTNGTLKTYDYWVALTPSEPALTEQDIPSQ